MPTLTSGLGDLLMRSTLRMALLAPALTLLAIGASTSRAEEVVEESPPDCFSEQRVHETTVILEALSTGADEIARQLVEDSASPQTIYSATRQLVLVERMRRRLGASDVECPVAMDSMARDFAILERTFDGFANGNAELEIDKVGSEKAQGLLTQIAPIVDALGERLKSPE